MVRLVLVRQGAVWPGSAVAVGKGKAGSGKERRSRLGGACRGLFRNCLAVKARIALAG